MSKRSRLAWRCRRGMREMDILFEKFVQLNYENLTDRQKTEFENFLDEADVDIYAWLTGQSRPDNHAYEMFVNRLKEIQSKQE